MAEAPDAGDLHPDAPSELLAAHGESTALGIGQAKRPRAQVLPEDPILLPEIRDQIVLVAVHPASERENERTVAQAAWPEITWETRPALTGPRPIKRTLRGRRSPGVPDLDRIPTPDLGDNGGPPPVRRQPGCRPRPSSRRARTSPPDRCDTAMPRGYSARRPGPNRREAGS